MLIKISGLTGVLKKVSELDKGLQNKLLQKGFRAGSKIMQKEAVRLAPEDTGLTKSAIKVRAMKRKRGRIGISLTLGKKDFTGESYYAAFTNFGTKDRETKKGQNRGKSPDLDYLGIAADNKMEASKDAMLSIFKAAIEKGI